MKSIYKNLNGLSFIVTAEFVRYLKFAISDQRPAESNSTNKGTKEKSGLDHVGCRVGGEMGEVNKEGRKAGENSSSSDQTVESCYQLR